MIDFERLVGRSQASIRYELLELYETLDVRSSHTELRDSQREALNELTERNEEKDLILKISTGAGKTTIGLLYLYGHMRVSGEPVVYLCPTRQLSEQVCQEARRLGIPASIYAGGARYPDLACSRGESIIVCTYEKLFNARTTFHRSDVSITPKAIVLDDAHAGVEAIRKQFTLKLSGKPFGALIEIIRARCKDYNPTKWADLEHGEPQAIMEIPYWIWHDLSPKIQEGLHEFSDTNDFGFVWPYIEDIIPYCRCVVASDYAEIAPEISPIQKVWAYAGASHRLFMSATLVDDSVLIRELGAEKCAVDSPLHPESDRGMGERMIVAPALISPDLSREWVMRLCREISDRSNVVVLTSSSSQAEEWEEAGASSCIGDDFSTGLERVKAGEIPFAVFAQRFDGVDLPDESCRVLVIDGIPYGESLIDLADSLQMVSLAGVRNRTIFRVEQGMGRAVRSHADFAVVLLVGEDLSSFVGRKSVQNAMTPDTRNQINLSIELAELAKQHRPENPEQSVAELIGQCLNRDKGWKRYYNSKVRQAKKEAGAKRPGLAMLAAAERTAFEYAMANMASDGRHHLTNALNNVSLEDNEGAVYLQRLARLIYPLDKSEAMKIQKRARKDCNSVFLPPEMPKKPSEPPNRPAADLFCDWMGNFSEPNAAVIEADRISGSLDLEASPKNVEASLHDLGAALGARSFRPEDEYGEGPDNLWFWGDLLFVIEAKSGNKNSLHKKDSGQLHDSLEWAKSNYKSYKGRIVPLIVAKICLADSDAHFPEDTRVLTQEGLDDIGASLKRLCRKVAEQGPLFIKGEVVQPIMESEGIAPSSRLRTHTQKII
ncbi:DEAD/DEAH box helicase [Natronospira bacteriovora]|uniref:DEAD/DEAH box helicase n=1 Tax=Natronospira bacteriovora TaxID=3069753 RepID=A0ABU0W718_9GAMM|nr:DEAD/DEAH box helicase [Natronospira sp. AB-CW4]MDQ2069830.1 DEAD/DEAH box helicase [Natronospira sp. AB-CW4]